MHRSEGEVEAKQHQPEIRFAEALIEHVAECFRPVEVEATHESEERSTEEDVMEMSDDEVRVGLL
ncbi:unannotated protein [freshwater metagenome]|uniref:Unannotated protein n=1 Tax=freshwater metagenome TaxID=449393 RepID=A0A6J6RPD8_9ZZZZ